MTLEAPVAKTGRQLPRGVIVMWSGALADIPAGFALCDGTNGTPDLTHQFIRSASVSNPPGGSGGSSQHSHNNVEVTGDGHNHNLNNYPVPNDFNTTGATESMKIYSETITASGTTGNVYHYPPYYYLALIMKL